ncbi:hypothetical protein [Schlesneria paludicola]|uniref:hypothetical protein n=1 Tax=Schlesneria paludicola TaxID=360056 RepID=UPI00029B4D23|nr:hypothetical protein [Schlesneria paludicola]
MTHSTRDHFQSSAIAVRSSSHQLEIGVNSTEKQAPISREIGACFRFHFTSLPNIWKIGADVVE